MVHQYHRNFYFLLGFPSGITLASINWFRMGMKRKALVSIFGGIVCLAILFALIPDEAIRGLAVILNLVYLFYVRNQMAKDINNITGYKIRQANWFNGCTTSLIGWGLYLFLILGVGFLPNYYHYYKGDDFLTKNDYENAITSYTKAIKYDPTDAYAYNNRGRAYIYLKDYEHAIADFNKAK